jgi:peptide/nickel transport system ATP-binding protein
MTKTLLKLQNVNKVFKLGGLIWGTRLVAVDNVTLSLSGDKPSIVSIVGESGSGKTTLAKIILRLQSATSGTVLLDGKNVQNIPARDYYRRVQPIFQNPFETFSARKQVETYLYDTALDLGLATNRIQAREIVANALTSVGLDINIVSGKYPNQFSGGELQRISVARGLIPRPSLIVADEPVSMIDASLRMNIVNLFLELKETYNVSFLYITHDLSTAYYVSDTIGIMYRGNLVEFGPSDQILTSPGHPYTELLLNSVPMVGHKWTRDVKFSDMELREYEAAACKFANRCPYAQPICRQTPPPLVNLGGGRQTLCYKPVDYEPGRATAKLQEPVLSNTQGATQHE